MPKRNYAVYSLPSLLRIDSKTGRIIFNAGVSFLAGLLASRAAILGGLAPFGIAAVAAVPKADSLSVLLGAVLGNLLPYGPENAGRYIAAAIAVFLIQWVFSGFEQIYGHPAFSPAVAAGAVGMTGLAAAAVTGGQTSDFFLCLAETLLCPCAVVFFRRALPFLHHPSKLRELDRHELVSVTIAYSVMLLALSGIRVSGISLGRILGVFSVLVAAHYGAEAGGSITGVAFGLIFGLGSRNMAQVLPGYGFGGLVAGIFSPLGRFGCTVAFILANGVACLYAGATPEAFIDLYEVLIATLLFMLLPERLLCRFSSLFVPAREGLRAKSAKSSLPYRLRAAADALRDVSQTVSQVSTRLAGLQNNDISSVYSAAADLACKRCGMRLYCWETAYNDTMDALGGLTDILKSKRRLERDDIPRHFASRCCRLSDMISAINRCYAEFAAENCAAKKADMLRGLLVEQFAGVADFLKELGDECLRASRIQLGNSGIRAAFTSCGLNVSDAICYLDEKGRMTVEAELPKKSRLSVNRAELKSLLKSACGRSLEGPSVSDNETTLTLSFTQKPAYSVAFGHASVPKGGEKLCGDACESFIDDNGRAVMMLSDGMGCGGSAAVDSHMTLKLLSGLLRSGFSFEPALRIVNTSLLLKSRDESFATVDIASLDLFTGEAEFLKAGAPPTYIRRCGRVERIAQSSMPAGILRDIHFERAGARLHPGDLIVMISDGVAVGDDAWLCRLIEGCGAITPDELAETICERAKKYRNDGHDDDITVNVAVVGQNL